MRKPQSPRRKPTPPETKQKTQLAAKLKLLNGLQNAEKPSKKI
jgi:hypothetical protein